MEVGKKASFSAIMDAVEKDLESKVETRGRVSRFARENLDRLLELRNQEIPFKSIAESIAKNGGPVLTANQLSNAVSKARAAREQAAKTGRRRSAQ
jgi:hypothetical protein